MCSFQVTGELQMLYLLLSCICDKKGNSLIYINLPLCICHSVHQIHYITYQKPKNNLSNSIYSLKCNICDGIYVGQTGHNLKIRCLELLNNKHKFSPIQTTMQLIKTVTKGWHMNCPKNLYIQQYQLQGSFIDE